MNDIEEQLRNALSLLSQLEKAAQAVLAETDCEGECAPTYPETCAARRLKDLLPSPPKEALDKP